MTHVATYKQPVKADVRHLVLEKAVRVLTSNRGQAACVRGEYVYDLWHYFVNDDSDSSNSIEAQKIKPSDLAEWRRLWTSCLGQRRPEDLKVCYLSGPEPLNDFNVLCSLGVLPSNIWAFESDKDVFDKAVSELGDKADVPHLLRMPMETFFASSPMTFDIVYLDACGTLVSDQHVLRAIADLFRYQRLQSPGVLITNLCIPDFADKTVADQYAALFNRHKYLAETSSSVSFYGTGGVGKEQCKVAIEEGELSWEKGYSELVTYVLGAVASVSAPALRVANTGIGGMLRQMCDSSRLDSECRKFGRGDMLLNLLTPEEWAEVNEGQRPELERKISEELRGSQKLSIDAIESLRILSKLRSTYTIPGYTLDASAQGNFHQFLDEPHIGLLADLAIGQLACPMFPVVDASYRIEYKAKTKRMFTDLIVFDACRYIYDWMPLSFQLAGALNNPSRQYPFRFALDGLVKQRLQCCTDYFYKGSVVGDSVPGFESKKYPDRMLLK